MLAAEPRILRLNFRCGCAHPMQRYLRSQGTPPLSQLLCDAQPCSSESEQRKLHFLRSVMGRDVLDLAECPAYALMRLGKVHA